MGAEMFAPDPCGKKPQETGSDRMALIVDTRQDVVDPNDGVTSLREALGSADVGATITFDAGVFSAEGAGTSVIRLTQGPLPLPQDVTINGDANGDGTPDVILSGDANGDDATVTTTFAGEVFKVTDAEHNTNTSDNSRLFNATDGDIEIVNLVLTGGAALGNTVLPFQSDGGAIRANIDVDSLRISDSLLAGNRASGDGGAIDIEEQGIPNILVVEGSKFYLNRTGSEQGAFVGGSGGAIDATRTDVVVVGSLFENNGGDGDGGAINLGTAVFVSEGSSFISNFGYDGGALNLGSAAFFISNTTIAGNISDDKGGGIRQSGPGTISSSTITGNLADFGGGLFEANNGSEVTSVVNSIIAGNGAVSTGSELFVSPRFNRIEFEDSIISTGIFSLDEPGVTFASSLGDVFETVTIVDNDGVPNSGDEFEAGDVRDNGGGVPTAAILAGGSAQNAGDSGAPIGPLNEVSFGVDINGDGEVTASVATANDFPFDARGDGFDRVADGAMDLGAFEVQVNQPPVAHADSIQTTVGKAVTIDVLANDSDPDGDTLTLLDIEIPDNGEAESLDDGRIVFTPNADFTGTETFTYTVTDGNGGTDNATVSVSVRAESSSSDVRIDGTVFGTGAAPLADTIVRFVVDGAEQAESVTDAVGGFTLQVEENTAGALELERSVTADDIAEIGVGDALDALRLAVGLEPSWGPADGADFVAADFDGNGAVNVSDALDILRTAVGLDTGGSQPRWVFGDIEADGADADNVPSLTNQIDIAALTADTQINIQGILVGNMENYV